MHKQHVLLIDLRSRQLSAENLKSLIPHQYHVGRVTQIARINDSIRSSDPRLLLFLYDYPQIEGLAALSSTKQAFPAIPILMLTEQHSEGMAIWAFQTGVRDFMYSPYTKRELEQRIALFSDFSRPGDRRRERLRSKLPSPPPIPDEALFNVSALRAKRTMLALSYIRDHIHNQLTLAQVAGHCSMSTFAFSHAFKEDHGISFQEYLGRCRIRKAQQLLRSPELSITSVALSSGFADLSHFSRKFRQLVGISPSAWRRETPTEVQPVECLGM